MANKHCVNIKSKEFLDLVDKTGLEPVDLAAKISLWQDENNSEKYPSLDYFKDIIKNAETKVESNELSKLTDKVTFFLEKKLAILKNKKIEKKAIREKEISGILSNIKALEGVESINIFIEDSYNKIKLAEKQFDTLLKDRNTLSDHELITKLSSFGEFVSGYSILDEISKADIEEYFSKPVKGLKEESSFTTQDKLSYSILARDKIKQRYIKQGIPLLAKFLLKEKSKDIDAKSQQEIKDLEKRISLIEKGNLSEDKKNKRIQEILDRINKLKGFSLDEEKLIKDLQLAAKDESALDFLFSPLISSDDSVLALFAKSIKSELEKARLQDIEFAKKADKMFTDFSKESNLSKDNVEKFNKDIYEEIEIPVGKDGDGNTVFIKKKAFVQKYDVTKFEKAKSKFFKELGPKPEITPESTKEERKKLKDWYESVATWFSNNTQPKSKAEIDKILSDKKKEVEKGLITQEEYDTWLNKQTSEYDEEVVYKYDLAEPSNEYLNPKYKNIYNEDGVLSSPLAKYHDFLLNSYLDAQQRIPESFRRGYILPSIPKGDVERLQTKGITNLVKTKLKEATKIQDYDTEFGIAGLTGEDAKFLPVYFTQNIDSEDVSTDLISSIMRFNSMANRYEALNNISGEISLAKSIIGEREVQTTNSKGQPIVDAFAKKMGYNEFIRKNGESYSKKHLDAFVDMIVYGEMQKAEEIFGLDAGKVTNTLLGYSSVTTIALDLLKGVANNIQGNIQLKVEVSSKEFFTSKNLLKGKAYYNSSIPAFLSDFNNISPKALPNQLIELYDAFQGKFIDEYGRDISGSTAKKLFRTNTLFFNQNFGEHEIQTSALFAILDSEKVKTNEGEETTLLEAYKTYGIDGVIDNTDFTEDKRKDLQNRLHALNKRLHGVYNDFDKGTAQRYSLGRLAIMYRKFLIPSYKRRFKKLSADQELGGLTEGYYRTFWNTFIRDLRDFKFNIVDNWSTYSTFEKQQIRRTIAEAGFILALTALVLVLKSLGDDDERLKKNYTYNFLLYQATRLRSETSAFINPLDAYRVVKSPSAMTSTLDRTIKFTDQLIFTWDPEKLKFQKKTGIWEKGDNKSWAYFLKLMGFSGYNITPEQATKAFEGTLNR